jgi:ABC-type nitrate/sulfonate/bicarbonate transport system permease component
MANQSTLLTSALLLMSNSTDLDQQSIGSSDTDDHHRYVIERFRLAFVVLGIALGVIAIGFNTAIVISSLVVKSSTLRFSSQTINLMASLAVADLFLLVFGTDNVREKINSTKQNRAHRFE